LKIENWDLKIKILKLRAMQFVVPQFIEVEDKIMGPFTMKQFLMAVGAGALIFIMWYLFQLWFVVLFGGLIVIALLISFFVKVNGRSFTSYFVSGLTYYLRPKIYVWKRRNN